MRLLEVQSDGSFSLVGPQRSDISPYAILSHTWGADHDEVTYQDLYNGTGKEKHGYNKISFCKEQTTKDGLCHFWIDTCCINKSSEPELSEAIRSMFKWYRNASKCYVYLSDVSSTDCDQESVPFSESRWFTRGWTLQELLAPSCVQFFSKEGVLLGDKHSLAKEISEITRIPVEALQGHDLSKFSVEERMRWAEERKTTREEDQIYSLLGIFNIHIPIMYGEGEGHARKRMREVIEASTVARDAKLSQIERWLSAPDPSVNYQKALKLRQHNTGRWLLDGERYETWKIETASCIWLYGIPGCGKTLLSSTILEDVFRYCDEHPGYAVAYFYFDFNDIQKQNAERMLRSLVVQLLQKSVDIPSSLDALFSSHDNGKRPPALDSLLKVARDLIEHFPQVYIVLDALDECNQWSELMEMLETIASWEIPNLHLIMTSRAEPDIKSTLTSFVDPQNSICLQSNIVDRDIQLYIRQRLSDDKDLAKWKKDPDIQQEIETALTKGSKGMFRWAACQLDTLGRCLNRSLLRKTLKTLPSTLDKTYERILGSISDEYAEYAICILQWLAFSERPLSVEELAEVIAIDVSRDPEFDRDEVLEDPMDVLRICSSLVSITAAPGLNLSRVLRTPSITLPKREVPVRQIIMLAHYSVKEYLISDRVKRGQAARYSLQAATCHGAMAVACLGYLNQFQEPELLSEQTLEKFKLASYSARFWSEHARKAGDQEAEVARFVCRLLSMDNPAYFSWIQIIEGDFFWFDPSFESIKSIVPTPLYCASLLGLDTVVEQFLTQNSDPNARGGTYGNALQAASVRGHDNIVKLLLSAGADVNAQDGQFTNALQAASVRGYENIVKLLLSAGADVNAKSGRFDNALQAASVGGHENIVKVLLSAGADVNANGGLVKWAIT
ncbi:hypothetical protein J3E72DRAFT_388715 [Bipolaris maydis]|nr:hypothetical protein J3E74DRAFT_422005 [Bipolaris maydis]KAJ6194010.1 hypothetical protein J3E72DRAFT_388715 [Bipolaris maydis]